MTHYICKDENLDAKWLVQWKGDTGIQSKSVGIQNACLFCIEKIVQCGNNML